MKQLHIILVSIFTGLLMSFSLLSTVSGKVSVQSLPAGAATAEMFFYVAPGGNCGGMLPCHATIQHAVNAASPGAVIKVAAGVYSDTHQYPVPTGYPKPPSVGYIEQVVYITKMVTIEGGYVPTDWITPHPQTQPTILDGGDRVRVVLIWGDASPTLIGLQITGGKANGWGGWDSGNAGGGILVYSSGVVTVQDCRVIGNRSDEFLDSGGGIALDGGGSLNVIRTEILSNTVSYDGGGISVFERGDNVFLKDSVVAYNRAVPTPGFPSFGGGVFLNCFATLDGNLIQYNTSETEGGGIWHDAVVTLTNNLIFSNTSERGGGAYTILASTHSQNNVFARNHADLWADGIFVRGGFYSYHDTFVGNDEVGVGAMDVSGRPANLYLTNTIVASQTIGIGGLDGDDRLFVNGILWHNTSITVSATSNALSSVQNQYYGDPVFAADGYHLQWRPSSTAAIDRGVVTGLTTDIDGEPRRMGKAPDLGADELLKNTIDSRLKFVSLEFNGGQGTLVFDFQSHNLLDNSIGIMGIQNAVQLNSELVARVTSVSFSQALFTAPNYIITQDYRSTDGRIRYIYTFDAYEMVRLDQTWQTVLRVTVQFNSAPALGSVFNWNSVPTYFVAAEGNDIVTGQREDAPPELLNFSMGEVVAYQYAYLPIVMR